MSAKFEQNFWGEGNPGFEVLLQNLKAGISASKELGEFVKERVSVEDSYMKGLAKLQKTASHVSDSALGAFAPMWSVLKDMCEKLSTLHSQFVQSLSELAREIAEYNNTQKDKLRINIRGEIEHAQEGLQALEGVDVQVHRTKKLYQQSCDQVTKLYGKLERARADPNTAPKAKQQLESRVKQAEDWRESMKGDHKGVVQRHSNQLTVFQSKMVEACQKFESLEEEHIAQMVTFVIKLAQTHESHHVHVEQVYLTVKEQLDALSVEKLLREFVATKGTGTEKPKPYKFSEVSLGVPSAAPAASSEDLRSPSPTTGTRTSKGEKGFRHRFKKKLGFTVKGAASASVGTDGPTGASSTAESVPQVDEEGYSIRPEDAATISQFPDEPRERGEHSDSDSDSEEERDRKLRKIQIKVASERPTATVDDIKASVMSLKLGRTSPSIRKATSSQSLHTITALAVTTPPVEHQSPIGSSKNLTENTSSSSLLDADISLDTHIPAPLVPAPLVPTTCDPEILFTAMPDPTETLTPWNVTAARATSTSVPPLLPQPTPPHTSFPPDSQPSEDDRAVSPKPVPRPRTSSHKKPSPEPSRKEGPGIIPPPLPSKRKSATNVTKSAEEPPSSCMGIPPAIDETKSMNTSELKQDPEPRLESSVALTPPIPAPRKGSSTRRRPSVEANATVSPLVTTQRSALSPGPSATPPSNGPVVRAPSPSPPTSVQSVPIAIAFQETCNAIFKGTDVSQCVVKVTGEMVVSLPSNYLGKLGSHSVLQFQLSGLHSVERLRHNQHLLVREGDSPLFKFNMAALLSHLSQMAEKHSAPFYNVPVLKYEVGMAGGGALPLKLVCYWKCEPTVTNFRLDYTFVSSVVSTNLSKPSPPLSNVVISVPVSGGVGNVLSKPVGVWTAEENKMVWKLGNLQPTEPPDLSSLHAKFEVSSGPTVPTPVEAQFLCDGATLSGLDLELVGGGYHISLLKKKCSTGKYMAQLNK